jgi:hypothetical protein
MPTSLRVKLRRVERLRRDKTASQGRTRATKSVIASVTGPAAIFGSSFNEWSNEGILKPNRHAVTSDRPMLPSMASAAVMSCPGEQRADSKFNSAWR